jgi:hypothetical protein
MGNCTLIDDILATEDLLVDGFRYAKKRPFISWCESNPSIDYSDGNERSSDTPWECINREVYVRVPV